MNKYILKFETASLLKNYATIFFGTLFPMLLCSLIIISVKKQVPKEMLDQVEQSIMLNLSIISPLSIFFIGLSSVFAKDLEEGVYDRLELFSINHLTMARYKFFVNYIFWFICNAIYFAFILNMFDLNLSFISLVKHFAFVSLLSLALFLLSYAICLFTKKFSISFAATMLMYFGILILSGMMGIMVEDLPAKIKTFAKLLPTSHFSSTEYLDEIAKGGSLNYSFLQSLIVFLLISFILFAISVYKNKRKNS
ncbi:MAG: ABC transporter permease [Peptoniphilaceae bacterium]|nr:ABC transporter permease [Peptoniphilaceae bacterium]MDY6018682.1 ABC transporter permease [Anaerococcus sp.]